MYAWRVRVRGVCVACARSWRGVHMYLYILLLSYVYTLRLIGPISYPGECDLLYID